jgi:VWFA-related protein
VRRTVALGLGLALATPQLTNGQARNDLPRFDATLNVVAVPAFVTDGAGRAIAGLSKEDFEITDDGQPVEIVGFQAFDSGDPDLAEVLEEAPAARRQFLLLFDLSFSTVAGLVRAREAALEFASNGLRPFDLAAVATVSATHGVRLLQGFSSDRAQVRKALTSLGVMQVDRRADPLGLVYDLREVGEAFADSMRGEGTSQAPFGEDVRTLLIRYQQSEKSGYEQRILALMDSLGHLGKALGSLQGRKQVILFSSGFEASSLSGNQGEEQAADSEAVIHGRLWEVRPGSRFGETRLRTEMERALRSFSTSDAVVHAVDLSGLAAPGEVSRAGKEPRQRAGEESLEQITNLGGGRLFKKTNDVGRALAEVLELSRYYYLLAFEPARAKGPGQFHKLRVRARGKGTRVSHRAGYFERKPYAAATPLEREFEAAEIIAKGIDRGEIGVRTMAVPYRSADGAVTLPVVLELDGPSLLEARTSGKLGLEVFGYAFDSQGEAVDSVAINASLDSAALGPRLRERGAQLHATFTLAPGKHDLRVLVRDAETGRSGSSWLAVTVPAFDTGSGVALFPPLFMDDPKGWVVLHARSVRTTGDRSPFVVDQDPFVPQARPRLRNGEAQRVCLLAFDGGVRFDPGTSFEIKPALVDHDGEVVSVGKFQVLKSTAEDGFRRFVLGFTPRDVPTGDYSFRVRLRDPASGRISAAYQAVSFD